MSPLVSVIIPVYNCEAYVAEAVESALQQDHPNKEIIVVNDGSTDGTLSVLHQFGDAIRVIDKVNGGPPEARNSGLKAARGDYISFLDADDVWLQGKISAQVAYLEANRDVGTCYFGWHVWYADSDGVFRRPEFAQRSVQDARPDLARSGWIYGRLLFDCELLTTTVMVRASVARQAGEFNSSMWNGDDYDYWIRLSQLAKISRLDPAGALYRVVKGSVSRRARPINDELVVIEQAVSRFGLSDSGGVAVEANRFRRRLDQLVFQHGYQHLHHGDPGVAVKAFSDLLRRQPWRPSLWVNLGRAAVARARGAAFASTS